MGPDSTYVLAYVGVADEELCAQVLFRHDLVVCECDGAYAGQYEVLCDFVGERFDRDEEDVGGADSGLVSTIGMCYAITSHFSCA
jgi:hypothetical protein